MCGRYLLYAPVETPERTFALDLSSQRPNLEPHYNMAPTLYAPISRLERADAFIAPKAGW